MRGFEISDSSHVGDHHRLPALIAASSVLLLASGRVTVPQDRHSGSDSPKSAGPAT